MKWLEVSLRVHEELSEPVAEVLGRHARGGVALSQDDPARAIVDVRGYMQADDQLPEARAALERDLWYLGRIRPLPAPEYIWIEDSDWAEAWKAHFKALLVGRRLRVQPAWLPLPDDDRITILIDPGMAFGTGTHPTTQLCLELLEDYVRPGDGLADLGCGSGILSIASAKLGAARCLAYDTDPQAVAICQENAAVNSVQDRVVARVGSLPELLSDAEGLQAPRVILANIYLSVLCDMLDHGLEPTGGPSGCLVLSGILDEQEPELLAAARRHGLQLVETRRRGEWRALVFAKNEAQPQ